MRQQLVLEQKGYNVLEADNGAVGVEVARNNDASLIIADVHMPVMDGLAMIAEVRQLPNHTSTPIFMLTTDSRDSAMAQAKGSGATAWIIKPFNPDKLMRGVEMVLNR